MSVRIGGVGSEKETRWRALLEEYEGSGLTIREFCRQRDLAGSTFALWRRRLGRVGRTQRAAGAIVRDPVPAAPFVSLGMAQDVEDVAMAASPRDGAGWDIRLDLGDGVVVSVRRR